MAPRKDDSPSVATFADHEVITPAHDLRKAAVAATGSDGDPIARAEAALAELSSHFHTWMQSECDRLEAARLDVQQHGLNKKSHETLFRAAHDIKGEAATFGFPEITGAAESLCRLLEHTPQVEGIPTTLLDQHVDAVRAIAREHARPDVGEISGVLIRRLREVTDEFLKRENSFRPDYLESIFSPPLAPSGGAGES